MCQIRDKKWYLETGCFSGSLVEFEKQVKENHGANEHGKRYRAVIAMLEKMSKI
jgi:hypothetical protein